MPDYNPAYLVLLSVLVWTTSAIAGALIGASIERVRLCAALGLLLGPLGIIITLFLSDERSSIDYEALGPDLPRVSGPVTRATKGERADMKSTLGDGMR